jgi:uncharacterized 2Fe-2S/4Fe-4S cluster protein (DUF4445 family)
VNPDLLRVRLEPSSQEVEIPRGAFIGPRLSELGFELPCGGTGRCGGCGIRVLSGSLPVTPHDIAAFSASELDDGWRLGCQARAETPLVLECGQWRMDVLMDHSSLSGSGRSGLGIAIDLGTTTIAAQLIDLDRGNVIAFQSGMNPQSSFGSDVMSRIRAAMDGHDLTTSIRAALRQTISNLGGERREEISEVVLVGNTVMHHLFAGIDVEPLSRVPFQSPELGVQFFTPKDLDWPLPPACRVRFERCIGGFVGSDILAGILAVGMQDAEQLTALVDLGTNGEIAIGNRRGIVCASTAAGPAFEGGSIRMGMRATTGAVSRILLEGGETRITVIGDVEARGICGSGLVDAVAAGLETGRILASGRISGPTKVLAVADSVVLVQADIRELQLAKGAIAAGFKLLLRRLGKEPGDLQVIHLAGAFGNCVRAESALDIGLIEAPSGLIHAAGNTALRGAKTMLLSPRQLEIPAIEHMSLAADPGFQEEFAHCMSFPEKWTSSRFALQRRGELSAG